MESAPLLRDQRPVNVHTVAVEAREREAPSRAPDVTRCHSGGDERATRTRTCMNTTRMLEDHRSMLSEGTLPTNSQAPL